MKANVCTVCFKGWDIQKLNIVHPKVAKTHACNPNLCFDNPNQIENQKVIKKTVEEDTASPSSMIENPLWDLSGFPECIYGPLDDQNDPKVVPKNLQMNPKIVVQRPQEANKVNKIK